MADETAPGKGQPEVTSVSLEEHNRVKTGLIEDLAKARKEKREAEKRLQLIESEKSIDLDDLSEAEKKLFEKNKNLFVLESSLKEREENITEAERKWQAKSLATKHGVDEAELVKLDSVEAMEKYALNKELETLRAHKAKQAEAQKAEEKAKGRSKFEMASPSAGGKSVRDMDISTPEGREEFRKHVEKLKREAIHSGRT